MQAFDVIARSPTAHLASAIRTGLQAGQTGAVLARAGIGKSAFLVQVALDALLRGADVLHVSLDHPQAHVRTYYDEILSELGHNGREMGTALSIERHRVIHSCLGRPFSPADLRGLLETLERVMEFRPGLVVVDGLDGAALDAAGWASVAAEANLRMWLSIRIHRANGPKAEELAPAFTTTVLLDPDGGRVHVQILRQAGRAPDHPPILSLDPTTLLVHRADVDQPLPSPSPAPETCTVYATGAPGAEACFGELAERYHMAEVNYTAEGHEQIRARGRQVLGEKELSAGDVSLLYVSRRLHRTWKSDVGVRRVLQLLWQVVSHAEQVFVVGSIREDGVVIGGTGWSVELARRWNKPVWVYDQTQNGWYTWKDGQWTADVPWIRARRFAGTGTRHLSDAGRTAIEELFVRSFGS